MLDRSASRSSLMTMSIRSRISFRCCAGIVGAKTDGTEICVGPIPAAPSALANSVIVPKPKASKSVLRYLTADRSPRSSREATNLLDAPESKSSRIERSVCVSDSRTLVRATALCSILLDDRSKESCTAATKRCTDGGFEIMSITDSRIASTA